MSNTTYCLGVDRATGLDETGAVVVEARTGRTVAAFRVGWWPAGFEGWLLRGCGRFPRAGCWIFLGWCIAKRVWTEGWGPQWTRRSHLEFWRPPLSPRDCKYLDLFRWNRDRLLAAFRIPRQLFPYWWSRGLTMTERFGPSPLLSANIRATRVALDLLDPWRRPTRED